MTNQKKSNNDMSLKELLKLFAALRKARKEELQALKEAWPTPTSRQSKRLDKLQKELEDYSKKYEILRNINLKTGGK